MKRTYLILFSFLFLLPVTIEAGVSIFEGRRDIPLKAKIPGKPTTKSGVIHPFTAELIDNTILSIYADSPVANVTVSIYKDGILIDQDIFSFATGDTKIISLTGYESGDYMLVLTTPLGIYLQGTFSL